MALHMVDMPSTRTSFDAVKDAYPDLRAEALNYRAAGYVTCWVYFAVLIGRRLSRDHSPHRQPPRRRLTTLKP